MSDFIGIIPKTFASVGFLNLNFQQMNGYRVKTVLCATDFLALSENALTAAIELVERTKAKLVIINVLDNTPLSKSIIELVKEILEQTAQKLSEKGISTEYHQLRGPLYENIIRAVYLYAADIMVMGVQNRNGVSESILGSNAYQIIHSSPVPVLTVNADIELSHINTVVFPVNEDALTLQKADEVAYMAKLYHADVLILGVISDMSKTARVEEHVIEADHLLSKRNIKCSRQLVHGQDYAAEVLKSCDRNKGTVVAIASKQPEVSLSMFQGKQDEKLINMADIPVLSVPVIPE
jgi:nucleotide-binding universal stress UspA family protein